MSTAKQLTFIASAFVILWMAVTRAEDAKPPMDAATNTPALGGTHWALLSLTTAGEKVTDAQTPADVQFYKDGKWVILHYGGRLEGGTYEVKAGKLIMKYDDGSSYEDAKMVLKGNVLELDDGKWLLRLRFSLQDNK